MIAITFYSYKDGAGRIELLEKVRDQLLASGRSVCVMDMNLESPDLHLRHADTREVRDGVVQFFDSYFTNSSPPKSLGTTFSSRCSEKLTYIPAGHWGNNYWSKLGRLDFKKMYYTEQGVGIRLSLHLKALIEKEIKPDYLLINSGTGIGEISGTAITILSDKLIILSNNTDEHVDGNLLVAKSFLHDTISLHRDPWLHVAINKASITEFPKISARFLAIETTIGLSVYDNSNNLNANNLVTEELQS